MSLTPTEQRQFNDLGYLVREDIYSLAEMQPLKGALTALIDRTCATLQEEGLLGEETFADEPFETRLGDAPIHPYKLGTMSTQSPWPSHRYSQVAPNPLGTSG